MTDDRGAAALAERLATWRGDAHADGDDFAEAAAILGERGRFLPDGRRWDDLVETVMNMRLAATKRKETRKS